MAAIVETSELLCKAGGARAGLCDICDVRGNSICVEFGPREMEQAERTMARRAVARKHAIMSEGEPNDSLFVVVKGSFLLSKYLEDGRRQVTGFIFKGDILGVRPTDKSAYSAEALEDSLVCTFSHRYLDEIAVSAPGVKDRLIARGQTEYHRAQDHIVLLGKKNADERVSSFFQMLAKSVGTDLGAGRFEAPLSMARQDIADYLGLRLETLSRALASLKKAGVIETISRKNVVVKI